MDNRIAKISAGSTSSAGVSEDGDLYLWGSGAFGLYELPSKVLTIMNQVVEVELGDSVNAALDTSGIVWSWGKNELGELGVGDCEPRVHPAPILSL